MDQQLRQFRDYIQRVQDETGMSPTEIARISKVAATTITRPVYRPDVASAPTMRTISKIVHATGVEFQSGVSSQSVTIVASDSADLSSAAAHINPQSWPYDLPVYPLDAIEDVGAHSANVMGCYGLREESAEYCRRPPGVMGVPGAYVTYVPKNVLRRYAKGDALVVAPDRRVKPGDIVVMKVQSSPVDRVVSFLGILVSEADADWVEIGHELPTPTNNQFLAKTVLEIHKVLTTAEIIGL